MRKQRRSGLIDGFRRHAVKLVIEQGQQVQVVARSLGISCRLLNRWIETFGHDGDAASIDDISYGQLRDEVCQLRRERAALIGTLNILLLRERQH